MKLVVPRASTNSGFSLVELLITLSLFGILCSVAVSNITILENPLAGASANISHYFRLIRSRAISQTRSIQVRPTSSNRIIAESAKNCTDTTFTAIADLTLDLDRDVGITTTDWVVCFNQRGLTSEAVTFYVRSGSYTRQVQIALGGGVKVQ